MGEETLNLTTKPVIRLGEWLVRRGLIRREALFRALDTAYRHNCRLGDAVVWMHLLDRETLEREASCYHQRADCSYHDAP